MVTKIPSEIKYQQEKTTKLYLQMIAKDGRWYLDFSTFMQ